MKAEPKAEDSVIFESEMIASTPNRKMKSDGDYKKEEIGVETKADTATFIDSKEGQDGYAADDEFLSSDFQTPSDLDERLLGLYSQK